MRKGQVDITTLALGIGLLIFGLVVFYFIFSNTYASIALPSFVVKPIKVTACKGGYAEYSIIIKNPNDVDVKVTINIKSVKGVIVYVNGERCSSCVKDITVPAASQAIVNVKILSNSVGRFVVKGTISMNGELVGGFALPAVFNTC